MNLTSCQLCRQQISPLSAHCPSCGHPTPPAKKGFQLISATVPNWFFSLMFLLSGLGLTGSVIFSAMIFSSAKSAIHEQLSVQFAILAAICGLLCVVSAVAADQKR